MSSNTSKVLQQSTRTQRIRDVFFEQLPLRIVKFSAKDFVCESGVVVKSSSRLVLGKGVVLQRRALLHCGGKSWCDYKGGITLGNHVVIGPGCVLYGAGGIEVGDYTHLGPGSMVMAQSGNVDTDNHQTTDSIHKNDPIVIGKGAWIGAGAVILGNTILGDNCVVGPNSVVSGNYDSGTTLIGNPARVVIRRDSKELD